MRTSRLPSPSRFTSADDQARILREVREGKLRCTGAVTLLAGTTSTVVTDSGFGTDTVILPMPTTAAGAALKVWQASRTKGSVSLGHDAPVADAAFLYVAIG